MIISNCSHFVDLGDPWGIPGGIPGGVRGIPGGLRRESWIHLGPKPENYSKKVVREPCLAPPPGAILRHFEGAVSEPLTT